MAVIYSMRNLHSLDALCQFTLYRFTRVDPLAGLDIEAPCSICIQPKLCLDEILDLTADVGATSWFEDDPSGLDKTNRSPATPGPGGPVECSASDDGKVQDWSLSAPANSYIDGTVRATVYVYRDSTSGTVQFDASLLKGGTTPTTPVALNWTDTNAGWDSAVLADGLTEADVTSAILRLTAPNPLANHQEFMAIYVQLETCPDD